MSSSKKGRLIVGTTQVHDLSDLDWKKRTSYQEQEEEEFWARVKTRACEEAARIIAQAKKEAGFIRKQAREQGLNEGLTAARQEIEQQKQEMRQAFQGILASLSEEKKKIFAGYREDILKLIALVLEKVLQVQLQEKHAEILVGFLEKGLELLEEQQGVVVWVGERDQELVQELLEGLEQKYPYLQGWQVRADPQLEKGGVILENNISKVDSSVQGRWAAVHKVLADLQLSDPAEEQ